MSFQTEVSEYNALCNLRIYIKLPFRTIFTNNLKLTFPDESQLSLLIWGIT